MSGDPRNPSGDDSRGRLRAGPRTCTTSPTDAATRRKPASSTKTCSACRWRTSSRRTTCPSTGEYCPYVHIFFEMGDGSFIAFFDLGDDLASDPSPNTPAWVNHLALTVESVEHLQQAKQRLEAAGVEVVGVTDHGFINSIYFFDPNGIRLELTVQVKPTRHDPAALSRRADQAGRLVGTQGRPAGRAVRSSRARRRSSARTRSGVPVGASHEDTSECGTSVSAPGSVQPQLLRIDVRTAGPMESQSGLQMLRPRIYGALLEAPGVDRAHVGGGDRHPSGLQFPRPLSPRAAGRPRVSRAWVSNTRYVNNDATLLMERVIQDLGAGIQQLRAIGYRKVMLIGNSGGAALVSFYQAQAERLTLTHLAHGAPMSAFRRGPAAGRGNCARGSAWRARAADAGMDRSGGGRRERPDAEQSRAGSL